MARLQAYGALPDDKIDLAQAALTVAALFHPRLSLSRYENHLKTLAQSLTAQHRELIEAGAEDTPETQLAAIKHTLAYDNGYEGDHDTTDDMQNADLIRVIDRRKGNSAILSLLCIHMARQQGWPVYGLAIPGYFAVKLEKDGQRLIFDPFNHCELLQAADLRRLTKQTLGPQAELSADYYEAVSNRSLLIRLQNTMKLRQIADEHYEDALRSVEAMRALDPDEYRLLLDAGILYARTAQENKAIEALERYIDQTPHDVDKHDAALLLQELEHRPE